MKKKPHGNRTRDLMIVTWIRDYEMLKKSEQTDRHQTFIHPTQSVSQSVSFNHLLSKGCRDPNNEARVREYQWLMKHTRAGDKRAHDYCASFKTSYHPSETLWVRAQKCTGTS